METNENHEQELLFKQLTQYFMKEHLEQLKGNKKNKNNSFIYLESNTLNMLLIYLLVNLDNQQSHGTASSHESAPFPKEIFEELNSIIANNKEEFEEILSYLKEET
ncbi:hypothetical protein [Halalkalibacter flavus]|uniref:hypothetical protein n=1 Tax=Halalkalibacter flavus TaxID=3090668 RepID=UPI002FC86FEC